jgi:hypothetical protein
VLEASGADRIGECDGVARAVDVRCDLLLGIRLEIVDRREMEEVIDAALERVAVGFREAKHRLRQIADHGNGTTGVATPPRLQLANALGRALLAHQKVDDSVTMREQLLDEPAANEARGAGDEIGHVFLLENVPPFDSAAA